ncbi:hypothetical protein P167DRAFT_575776 [Morchella conica CCBAS932]|uniref:Uncharacterized protein n=1 Tax=Morchella conica CCBAS932 TaxID=1392247 RepID=A0A3N4KNL8_9PEZI|nr:hypothetical protein P167DRAFT_575776 [Morchella conica CCBAS932]
MAKKWEFKNIFARIDFFSGLDIFAGIGSRKSKSVYTDAAPEKILGTTEQALSNLRSLEKAIEAQYKSLRKLVKKADIAHKEAPQFYLEDPKISPNSVLINGGPVCALQTKPAWEQLNRTISTGGSSLLENCDSTYKHDRQHITNHHRDLLQCLKLDLAAIRKCYRKLKYNFGCGRKKEFIVGFFTDFDAVTHRFDWIWRSEWKVENWSDMKASCKLISKLRVRDVRIDKFNEMILYRSYMYGDVSFP